MIKCSFKEEEVFPDGSFRSTECINKAEILVLNDICYGLCYACAYEKLKKLLEEGE